MKKFSISFHYLVPYFYKFIESNMRQLVTFHKRRGHFIEVQPMKWPVMITWPKRPNPVLSIISTNVPSWNGVYFLPFVIFHKLCHTSGGQYPAVMLYFGRK